MDRRVFQNRVWMVAALGMLVVTGVVYFQVCGHDFVQFDDPVYVTENPRVQAGLTGDNAKWAFTTGEAANWHPLTWLSHMLDCTLFGRDAGGHHLVSLLFHLANSLLLLMVMMRMTGAFWRSFFVAAAFALHPLHVESVAWVAERKDVLSTLFWLMTLWLYLSYVERPGLIRALMVALCFSLGLMAKPMLVTLPFVLLLMDFWPLERGSAAKGRERESRASDVARTAAPRASRATLRRLVGEKALLFLLSGASCVVTFWVQKSGGAMASMQSQSFFDRFTNALVAYVQYIFHTVYPVRLSPFYPFSQEGTPFWKWAGAAMILIGITVLVVRMRRRFGYFAFGWFWYIGTLVPVIGLVQVGEQAMADRYTYVPLIGLFVAAAWGGAELLYRFRYSRAMGAALMVVVLAPWAFLSWRQAAQWKDSITLFRHAVAVDDGNYLAHNNLGAVLNAEGKTDEALAHIRRAIEIKPEFQDAHNNLGVILDAQGESREAIEAFWEAVRLDPGDEKAHYNLANALAKTGEADEAIKQYQYAVEIDPDYVQAYNNMGSMYLDMGLTAEAILCFDRCLQTVPDHFSAIVNLGAALARAGRLQEAAWNYRLALSIRPGTIQVMDSLAWLLATRLGNDPKCATEALQLARKACSMTRNARNGQAQFMDTLAVALAANGRFLEARQQAKDAAAMAEASGQKALAEKIRGRETLFAAGHRYDDLIR